MTTIKLTAWEIAMVERALHGVLCPDSALLDLSEDARNQVASLKRRFLNAESVTIKEQLPWTVVDV